MALTSKETSETNTDEVNSTASNDKTAMEQEEIEHMDSFVADEEPIHLSVASLESENESRESCDSSNRTLSKTRSVSFAPMVEEYEIPARSSISSDCSTDFLDALVESYKLQTSVNLGSVPEEKKYIRRTTHLRSNPNWREHRIRRLMNRLEELTLWDREEELKASQAQSLRSQKLEQIHDRQRNNDLCLQLMRQRHESEMESAVLLDQQANPVNKENIHAIISRTMNLTSPSDAQDYNLPNPPYQLKRRIEKEEEAMTHLKTPIGRYRRFENNMNTKLEKINQNFKPDWQIMRAYNPYCTSIPANVVPLFHETYASLLSIPDAYSRQSSHASSPDCEARVQARANRDVRVPLKDHSTDNSDNDDDDDDNGKHRGKNSRLSFSPARRSTSATPSSSSSKYDYSYVNSRQIPSNNIYRRSFHDDFNSLTYYSYETHDRHLPTRLESSNDKSTSKSRSSSIPANRRINFNHHDSEHFKKSYQPTMVSLSSIK
ncbi:unnamed protein product [Adineta ricciae]|uniref:Uncharacterized protein n=2 Tax=Adineta ricciae TaxID=249248 RepID=A0A816DTA2_ADIRI|nr:unnamed protein product [Adineta ricciae]